ncbi:putative non-specific serine/threonine protein kinase [Dioscorea sansibarensis]
MNKIAEFGLLDWSNRIKIINCLCSFILLEPCIAQVVVERLISMLQDCDYCVRFFLARRIQVLFQAWDGRDVFFHDIWYTWQLPCFLLLEIMLVICGIMALFGGNFSTSMYMLAINYC